MAEFNIRTDAVDVEQIMRQIRARIQDKRGVDYTEQQIQELANVKLERFLDPKGVRSDLVEQFRQSRDRRGETVQPELYSVDANELFGSSRALVRFIRKLLNPILKLALNGNRLVQVLHQQSELNRFFAEEIRTLTVRRNELDALYYELVHNLVLELTRIGIENRNLKMRVESLTSRLDFDERRARALEGVVQYRPGTGPSREPQLQRPPVPSAVPRPAAAGQPASPAAEDQPGESSTARRRRRRRRGRRGGRGRTHEGAEGALPTGQDTPTPPHGDPTAEAALDRERFDDEAADASDSEAGDTPDSSEAGNQEPDGQ